MSLMDKLKPEKISDLIGNPKAIKEATDCLDSQKPILLSGPPGVGKTSFVYAYANEKNYKVIEINASDKRTKEDMQGILRQMKSIGFFPSIFLFEEVDGFKNKHLDYDTIAECINTANHPVVLTCNDAYKVAKKIQNVCIKIAFRKPYLSSVSKLINKLANRTGIQPDCSNISNDIRNSILCAFYGGTKYKYETKFDIIGRFFQNGDIEGLESTHLVWLLDNAHLNYSGAKLYKFLDLLALCGRIGRFDPIKGFGPGNGRVQSPRYYKRKNILEGKEK